MGVFNWRMFLNSLMGISHQGQRDLYEEFGYKKETLSYEDYYFKYRRQNIARRLVNLPANATWAGRLKVEVGGEFDKAWERLARKAKLIDTFKRADKLAGLGPYAIIVLGFDDGRPLRSPVGRPTTLLYAQAYSCKAATIKEFETDTQSPRYGLPTKYVLKPRRLSSEVVDPSAAQMQERTVHWSRVVHIAEDALENDVLGTPRLEAVFNDLDDLLKVTGGTAETYWLTANRGMQANIDKDAAVGPDDLKALEEEMERYQHRISRFIRTKGVELKNLGADTPDPKATFDMLISLLSGTSGIPQRILLGSEAGQLASEQDRANWAQRVTERREEYGQPVFLEQTFDRLTAVGLLPEIPEDTEVTYHWPNPFLMSPLEEGQERAQIARAVINMSRQLEKPEATILARDECRKILGMLEPYPGPNIVATPEPEVDPVGETEEEEEEDSNDNAE